MLVLGLGLMFHEKNHTTKRFVESTGIFSVLAEGVARFREKKPLQRRKSGLRLKLGEGTAENQHRQPPAEFSEPVHDLCSPIPELQLAT
jgi:hypothetical protein